MLKKMKKVKHILGQQITHKLITRAKMSDKNKIGILNYVEEFHFFF